MKPSQVQAAFVVLEQLDQIKGQARNRRLKILTDNRDNTILREVFKLAYDWRIDLGVAPVGLGLKIHDFQTESLSLAQSWIEFTSVISETQSGGGFLTNRKKLSRFFDCTHPLVGKWAHRIINRDLQIFLSIKMLIKVWDRKILVPFHTPPLQQSRTDGLRVFIFIRNGRTVTFTDGFRKFAIANDAFAKQLARVCPNGVIEGWVTSPNWEFTRSLLSYQLSSLGKDGFKSIYYGIKFEALSYYSIADFECRNFDPDGNELNRIVRSLSSRSSISLTP